MISLLPVEGLPEIVEGDDLGAMIAAAFELADADVVVVSQKVVSKAEGAVVQPPPGVDSVEGRRRLAREQAVRIVADTPWVLIVETAAGLVCANAGIDASNADGRLTLLPADADASARRIRASIRSASHVDVAVVVADTFGRPWRLGQTDVAIGVAGLDPVRDERGSPDRHGTVLDVTEAAIGDELAGAADLVRTKSSGTPAVVVRGLDYRRDDQASAHRLVRPAAEDLFRRGRGMLALELAAAARANDAQGQPGSHPLAAPDLAALRSIAPGIEVLAEGPPTLLRVPDDVTGGLVLAALIDLDYRVRWKHEETLVVEVSDDRGRR